MSKFNVNEFRRLLKHATLLHNHGAIDRIVDEFMRTQDYKRLAYELILQTGSRDVVLDSAYLASRSYGISPDVNV